MHYNQVLSQLNPLDFQLFHAAMVNNHLFVQMIRSSLSCASNDYSAYTRHEGRYDEIHINSASGMYAFSRYIVYGSLHSQIQKLSYIHNSMELYLHNLHGL